MSFICKLAVGVLCPIFQCTMKRLYGTGPRGASGVYHWWLASSKALCCQSRQSVWTWQFSLLAILFIVHLPILYSSWVTSLCCHLLLCSLLIDFDSFARSSPFIYSGGQLLSLEELILKKKKKLNSCPQPRFSPGPHSMWLVQTGTWSRGQSQLSWSSGSCCVPCSLLSGSWAPHLMVAVAKGTCSLHTPCSRIELISM